MGHPPREGTTWDDVEGSLPAAISGEWQLDDAGPAEEVRYARGTVLGQGGMGTVYLADDPRLRRQVALKEARGEPGGPSAVRLRREARITAALDHPGIVPVFDTGTDEDGRPWYTMRVVRGRSLALVLRELKDLSGRLRVLRSLLSACEAVAYAHHRGIVHRDLKPDNILLGPFGETQVMDWGLARPVGREGSDWDAVLSGADASAVGAVLGTPAYMSPEQASGDLIDQRTDVWSLGVCLYELLAGRRPFRGSTQEILAQVLRAELPALPLEVPAELGAIIARATARQPEDRYASAAELAADLEAWLDGRRVGAHRYTAVDELTRAYTRFRRTVLAVGAVGLVALVAVLLAWRASLAERDRALAAQEALQEARSRSDAHLAQALVAQARAASRAGTRGEAETLAAHALALQEQPAARGLLMDSGARPRLVSDQAVPDCVQVQLSPDAQTVACRREGALELLEAATLEPRWRVETGLGSVFFTGAGDPYGFAPESAVLRAFDQRTGGVLSGTGSLRIGSGRVASGDHPHRVGFLADREASLLDLRTGERRSPKAEDRLTALWLDRDGTVLEVADRALVWRDWDGNPLRAPAPLGVDTTSAGHVSTLFAGRELLVLGFLEGRVEVRRRADGSLHSASQLVPGMVGQVRLSEGGRWVAAVDEPGAVWVWPVDDPGSRLRIAENTRGIGFLGDDELVVLGARLRRWALPDPAQAGRLSGAGGVSNLDWRGELLGAALGSGYARLWRLTDRAFDDVLLSDRIAAKDVAVAADGVRYAAGTLEAPLTVGTFGGAHEQVSWSAGGCRRVVRLVDDLIVCSPQRDGPAVMRLGGVEYPGLQRSGAELVDVEPDAGRTRAVMATGAGDVLLLEAGEPPTLRTLFELPEVSAVAISADGARVAVVLPRSVELRRADGAVIWSLRTDSRLRDIAFSPDDQLLAGGERSGLVRLWRVGDGAELAVLDGHDERAQAVVFSPDGTRLASGSWDETVRLWDLTALERSPASLLAEVEAAWGLSLEQALGGAAAP